STSKDRPRKDNRELAPWELRWRYSLTAADPTFEWAGLVEQPLADEVLRWAAPVNPTANDGSAFVVTYQLERPGASPETEGYPDAWFLRYMLQANDDPSVIISAQEIWEMGGASIEVQGRTFIRPHQALLESLAESAKIFDGCARSLYAECPYGVVLSTEEAWDFISRVGPVLFQFGLGVRLPRELRSDGQQRMRLKLHVGWDDAGKPSKVGMNELTQFRWQVALGEHDLTPEEFREIAAMKKPLVQWRGQWMAVDPMAMSEMERLFEGADSTGEMDRPSALSAALAGSMMAGDGEIEVVAEGEIQRLVDALSNREDVKTIKTPKTFKGELRPYQERGLTWLSTMTDLGFGCCLADDMGLGKTIQVIVTLLHQKKMKTWTGNPALLVCPTSVLGNWERELNKFAPSLEVIRYHSRNRAEVLEKLKKSKKKHQVVLTTYVIARMDQEVLAKEDWSHLIIDEAQNIKNPRAQQAIAIRSIPSERRMALTGTPVENRLTELWSILEFVNPGMLGTLRDFQRQFSLPIERFGDSKARDRLRSLVTPFILRRVKTDPNVIQDLPEKQEYKVYCSLTREQATLYQATVDAEMDKIENATGVQRRGSILALLTRLKQISNHPVHFLKDDTKLTGRSGKLARATEMLEEVIVENDRALIFTQYTEMGHLLVKHFEKELGFETPFIHGGVPIGKREQIVDDFQNDPESPPILLLSIKAGGTGLNLTKATHVFHYDRWWNPAVEDQATDRAYRLGQTRDVQVHKLIASGTVDEKIDEILESKRGLAESIVDGSESWITEMDDGELRELFSLGKSAAIYDDEAEA
ncbi:MAG: superfamily II DNA or RNA helicase, partial [Bradymonadia bacterium]